MTFIRDLRHYARQTNLQLIIGLFVLLVAVGLGLIYFFWGTAAALTGLICVGAAMLPVLAVVGVLWILDRLARKARDE